MSLPLLQVDAFTRVRYAGNPAAVCMLERWAPATWMQAVAREMNLSETAFLVPRTYSGSAFDLRWFTPAIEVDLCGHATLASAFALWELGRVPAADAIRFHTRSGVLTAHRREAWIELDFPAQPADGVTPPDGLIEALGVMPRHVGFNGSYYLVEVGDEEDVRGSVPDFALLARSTPNGVILTSRAHAGDGKGYDFVSRFFAPVLGIDEDPVTGSAHCCLGPYWAARLGKQELVGYQASVRGGVVRVRVGGNRVELGGQAVLVLRGELLDTP